MYTKNHTILPGCSTILGLSASMCVSVNVATSEVKISNIMIIMGYQITNEGVNNSTTFKEFNELVQGIPLYRQASKKSIN